MADGLPKAIIYDWDNTLIDTFPLLFEMTNRTRVQFGLEPWDAQTAKRNMRLPARQAWPPMFGADTWEDAYKFYIDGMRARHLDDMVIMPGARELIAWVGQQDIPQAIFSNKNRELLHKEVAHIAAGKPDFTVIVGSGDFDGDGKPDPKGLFVTMDRMGLEKAAYSDTWYVGDTENDLKTAQAAGVIPVFIENDAMSDAHEIALLRPKHSFKSCVECLAYLKSLG